MLVRLYYMQQMSPVQKKRSFDVRFRLIVAEVADIIEVVFAICTSACSYYVITLQRAPPEINSSRPHIVAALE